MVLLKFYFKAKKTPPTKKKKHKQKRIEYYFHNIWYVNIIVTRQISLNWNLVLQFNLGGKYLGQVKTDRGRYKQKENC